MIQPEQHLIDRALDVASRSPCRSQRGVILFDHTSGLIAAYGYNGPPAPFACPGREACKGTCGLRAVHAEMRALAMASDLRSAALVSFVRLPPLDLLHVERAADGSVVACEGPTCAQCSKAIVESGLVARVWLCVSLATVHPVITQSAVGDWIVYQDRITPTWVAYEPDEFHRLSMIASGVTP